MIRAERDSRAVEGLLESFRRERRRLTEEGRRLCCGGGEDCWDCWGGDIGRKRRWVEGGCEEEAATAARAVVRRGGGVLGERRLARSAAVSVSVSVSVLELVWGGGWE